MRSFVSVRERTDCTAQIVFRQGESPCSLPSPAYENPLLQVAANGDILLQIKAVGRFLLRAGAEAIVTPKDGATEADIEAVLNPTVSGLLLAQRRCAPLRAAVVATPKGAVAFLGRVGSGKSTLAAAFVERGLGSLLADDVVVLRVRAGVLRVSPGSTQLRLWPDTIQALSLAPDRVAPLRAGLALQGASFPCAAEDYPLHKAIFLRPDLGAEEQAVIAPRDARQWFPREVLFCLHPPGNLFGERAEEFQLLTRLADTVPAFTLRRPTYSGVPLGDRLRDTVDLVQDVL